MLENRNLTSFKKLLDASGLTDEFDSMTNVTFFLPTDKALESSEWMQKLESSTDALAGDEELSTFLKYHIAKPLTKTCELSEKILDTEVAGAGLRVNLYSTVSLTHIFLLITVI